MLVGARTSLWGNLSDYKGTILRLDVTEDYKQTSIHSITIADGHETVEIDWGDGTIRSYSGEIRDLRHSYMYPGEYLIKISDDISILKFTYSGEYIKKKDQLIEVVTFSERIKTLLADSFNNCHNLRGTLRLPGVTWIGSYALGSLTSLDAFELPSMTKLLQISFYGSNVAKTLVVDKVTSIESSFWEYYGSQEVGWICPTDVYLRESTCAQIKAMVGFPFKAPAETRFHGSDGIVLGNRTVIK